MSAAACAVSSSAACARAPPSSTGPALRRHAAARTNAKRHIVAQAVKEEKAVVQEPAPVSPAGSGSASPADLAASRRYLSFFPPVFSRATDLEQFVPGQLWGLAQPLGLANFDIRLRMTVARLPDGSLLLASPVAPTGEALALLASLGGEVSHIVLPSSAPEHWFYGPALSDAFAAATVWTVPGWLEGKGLPVPFFGQLIGKMRPRCKVLGVDPLPAELQGAIDWELMTAPFFLEAAVLLPKHRALLLADTGFYMDPADYANLSQGNIDGAKKVGIWGRLGPITKQVFDAEPVKGRAWVSKVLSWDFDQVVPAHASAPVRDGKRAFAECFSFLEEEDGGKRK